MRVVRDGARLLAGTAAVVLGGGVVLGAGTGLRAVVALAFGAAVSVWAIAELVEVTRTRRSSTPRRQG